MAVEDVKQTLFQCLSILLIQKLVKLFQLFKLLVEITIRSMFFLIQFLFFSCSICFKITGFEQHVIVEVSTIPPTCMQFNKHCSREFIQHALLQCMLNA